MKTTLADIIGTCERAAFRLALDPCAPPEGGRASYDERACQREPESAGANHQWTPAQDAAVIAMTKGGMLAAEIAGHVDICRHEIERRVVHLIAAGAFDAADAPPPATWPQAHGNRSA